MAHPITIARELVELSPPSTLVRAYRSESIEDVCGVHRSVLVARLGNFTPAEEDIAMRLLYEAFEYLAAEDIADGITEDPTEEAIIAALREVAP